jgi:tetratricopeptide (TPR) repeat protein
MEDIQRAIELDPNSGNYERWLEYLDRLHEEERRKAIDAVQKANDSKPAYFYAYFRWGAALVQLKKPEEAIEKFKKAAALNPDCADAYNGWGVALVDLKKPEEAIEQYKKATALNPSQPQSDVPVDAAVDAYNNWGAALVDLKKPKEAIEQYKKAAELQPNFANIYYHWGNVLGDQYRYEEAIKKLQKATKLDLDLAYAYHNIAYLLWREGRYSASWNAWKKASLVYERTKKKAVAEKNSYFFYYYGAMLHEIFGEFDKAEQTYKRGLAIDPNNVDLLIGLVNLHLEKRDQEVNQKKPWMLLKSDIHTDKRAKESAEAWKAYKKAEELLKDQLLKDQLEKRKDCFPLLDLGELYLTMKDYPTAEAPLTMARDLEPESATAWADLGVLSTRKDALKDAIEYFDNAVQRDPYDFTIRSNLAASYRKMNLTDKAKAEYKRILDVTQNHVESQIGLGEVYSLIGDGGDADMYDEAISHFSHAIQIAESNAGSGSKRLTKKDLAAAYYSRGYARVKRYEADTITKDESLLHQARKDFSLCFKSDPEHHKAYRAKEKLLKRLRYLTPQRLADRVGPLLIMLLSFTVFAVTQTSFFFHKPIGSINEPGYYALLSFGALIFMVAGLYLPQILKLKVAGIQLEKSAVEQITTSSTLGISKSSAQSRLKGTAHGIKVSD